MKAVSLVVYLVAVLLSILGFLFLFAAGQANAIPRIAIGVVMLIAAGALVALVKLRPVEKTVVHRSQIDVSGDVSLEQITCKQCGAALSQKSVEVAAGAVFVRCEHCGSEYQIEEAPKW